MIYRTSLSEILIVIMCGVATVYMPWRTLDTFFWHDRVIDLRVVNATEQPIQVTLTSANGRLSWRVYRFSETPALPTYALTARGPYMELAPGVVGRLRLLGDESKQLGVVVGFDGSTRRIDVGLRPSNRDGTRLIIDAELLRSSRPTEPLDDLGDGWQWGAMGRLYGYPLVAYLILLGFVAWMVYRRDRRRGISAAHNEWSIEAVEQDCPACYVRHDYGIRRCDACGLDLARARWKFRTRYWVRYRHLSGDTDLRFLGTSWLEAWLCRRRL